MNELVENELQSRLGERDQILKFDERLDVNNEKMDVQSNFVNELSLV